MKFKKKILYGLATLTCLLSLILCASFVFAYADYQEYVRTSSAFYDSKGLHGYYDLLPFSQWCALFPVFVSSGVVLAGLWIFSIYFLTRKRISAVLVLVIFVSMMMTLPTIYAESMTLPTTNARSILPQPALNYTQPPTPPPKNDTSSMRIIDVLCCGDEEFMSVPRRKSDVEDTVHEANTYVGAYSRECFEDLNITFQVRGWIEFDSRDDIPFDYSAFELLEEAITETGFYDGMLYGNCTIDLLFVITGQDIDMGGLSIPWWYALIMETTPATNNIVLIRHEFSHQLWAFHCDSYCCMNLDDFFMPKGWDWCEYHEQWLLEHKYIKPHDYNIKIEEGVDGGYTEPTENTNHIIREGTLSLKAFADYDHFFWVWEIRNLTDTLYSEANPMTLNIGSDYNITVNWFPAYHIILTNPTHGHTEPAAGDYKVWPASTFTITAYPEDGYYISTWKVTGSGTKTICGNQNPLHYSVEGTVTITPVFAERSSGGCAGGSSRYVID